MVHSKVQIFFGKITHIIFFIGLSMIFQLPHKTVYASERFFNVQSIDTVKYSRDVAVDKMNDESFDMEINKQVANIAATGATHIALGTPYDEQFYPFLKRWVDAARKRKLKIWYRGNLSGWEGWFSYAKIDREEHTKGIIEFIQKHSELFESGDIFTSCPECENGGPGDPRFTKDVDGFRTFIIDEYNAVKKEFAAQGKKIDANYYSMNGDVAKLIMDKPTTKALDGVVTIDHYVKDAETLMADIKDLKESSGGKIMLGEIGAPIPDIHGDMTDEEQVKWIDSVFRAVITDESIIGINYWVNMGGSTEIWRSDNSPKKAVETIISFYRPHYVTGKITNDVSLAINNVEVQSKYRKTYSQNGVYTIPVLDDSYIQFIKDGYITVTLNIDPSTSDVFNKDILMNANEQSIIYKFFKTILSIFRSMWI